MRCSCRSELDGNALEGRKALTHNLRPFDPSLLADSMNGLLIDAGRKNPTGEDMLSVIVRKPACHRFCLHSFEA